MKRWLATFTIAGYLGALGFGVVAHALNYKHASHPVMYFLVWDMFCGWAAYENRIHIIGEGDSGRYYELAPGPWSDFHPFGELSRHHYDPFCRHALTLAENTLRNTDHEPIQRIYVVEETWAKKFNVPDHLWEKRYPEPKEPYSYFHLRKVYRGDGTLLTENGGWFDYQTHASISDNPRLWNDSQKGKSFLEVQTGIRSYRAEDDDIVQTGALLPAGRF